MAVLFFLFTLPTPDRTHTSTSFTAHFTAALVQTSIPSTTAAVDSHDHEPLGQGAASRPRSAPLLRSGRLVHTGHRRARTGTLALSTRGEYARARRRAAVPCAVASVSSAVPFFVAVVFLVSQYPRVSRWLESRRRRESKERLLSQLWTQHDNLTMHVDWARDRKGEEGRRGGNNNKMGGVRNIATPAARSHASAVSHSFRFPRASSFFAALASLLLLSVMHRARILSCAVDAAAHAGRRHPTAAERVGGGGSWRVIRGLIKRFRRRRQFVAAPTAATASSARAGPAPSGGCLRQSR